MSPFAPQSMNANDPDGDRRGVTCALAAAVLFGASAPLAKVLLGEVPPLVLAGLLYLGSGVALVFWQLIGSGRRPHRADARLARSDLPCLLAVVLSGGLVGPALLMWGLMRAPASEASLLLNLEGVLTAALAWFAFRENLNRRIALGMLAMVAGGVLLSWGDRREFGALWGSLAIMGACLAWAVDNNLTRLISAADPVQIATVKGLVAGAINVTIGILLGGTLPGLHGVTLAALLGLVSYGVSLVLFILGLRHLGSARTAAYFSTAPFMGAALSIVLLGEPASVVFLAAAALMALGLWLHLTERHIHPHVHAGLTHDHWHEHDAHHQHVHTSEAHAPGPHAHPHEHGLLWHAHPHYPDIHHRHEH
jgi:drug/metabolite transporter (DMT)-like permease